MQITTQNSDNITTATLTGRMDAMTTVEFDRWFSKHLNNGESKFVLDLHGLDYISSAGLRSILSSSKQLNEKNGRLLICCLKGAVEEVFRMSGFLTIFHTFATAEEAIGALR